MNRAADSESRQTALLARWLAPEKPTEPDPQALVVRLLLEVEGDLAASYPPNVLTTFLEPLREAAQLVPEQRDPKEMLRLFEILEDLLEAAALKAT